MRRAWPGVVLQHQTAALSFFDRLRENIEAALEAATPAASARDIAGRMQEAVVEARVSLGKMREGVVKTEAQLGEERTRLTDVERRGSMARSIGDSETANLADEYAAKHRERVAVLERKLAAQRDELALAEREVNQMKAQLRAAREGRTAGEPERDRLESVLRDLDEELSGDDYGPADEVPNLRVEREVNETIAEAQLRELKKKMGR